MNNSLVDRAVVTMTISYRDLLYSQNWLNRCMESVNTAA